MGDIPMRRTGAGLMVCFAGFLIAWPVFAGDPSHRLRVGLIGFSSQELRQGYEAQLIEGLRERGYVEGKNLELVRRYADGQPERVGKIAKELATLELDAVVTTCTPTTRAMHKLASPTPLVMAAVSDPVGVGLIKSYGRPGGNVTGLAAQFEDLVGKMLELFVEAVPHASPIAVLRNPRNPVHQKFLRELAMAAESLNARLLPIDVAVDTNIDAVIDTLAQQGARALLALPDDTLVAHFRRPIIRAALRHRMPSFFGYREAVEDGALMSYGESRSRTYYRVAYYLDKLAQGAQPRELPVERPSRFELVVNLQAAKALGLNIPRSVLLRADQVIE